MQHRPMSMVSLTVLLQFFFNVTDQSCQEDRNLKIIKVECNHISRSLDCHESYQGETNHHYCPSLRLQLMIFNYQLLQWSFLVARGCKEAVIVLGSSHL